MASTPQVMRPWRCQAAMGNVPAPPRRAKAGRSAPTQQSSMPPVPNVTLANPGRVQPWPTSDACWSPAIPAMGGAPGSALAGPTTPLESTTVGRTPRGMRKASRIVSFHAAASPHSPVTPALLASVTCRAPFDRVHATQVSTVPKQRSRLAVGVGQIEEHGQLGGRFVGRHPDPLGLQGQAGPDRPQVLPTDPGSDGDAGRPVPDDGGGPLVGDADAPDRSGGVESGTSHLENRGGHGGGVELDEGRGRRRGEDLDVVDVADGPVTVDGGGSDPRRPDVDDEDAHDDPLTASRALRTATGGRACPG